MADNVAITPGVGANIAADDVGSVYFQKIKLDAGGDGASVPIVAGQQTMAASVPVVLASDQSALPIADGGGALTVDGTVTANQGSAHATLPWKVEGVAGGVAMPVIQSNAEILMAPNSTQVDQRLTVDDTVGGVQFTAFHADTLYVHWTCETAQCRVTFDGSAPTTTNGHIVNVWDSGIWSKALATAAKWIRTGSVSAVIHASQLK